MAEQMSHALNEDSRTARQPVQPGIVIVGSGLAGISVLAGLKETGYAGRICLIGEERHSPYDRPPLSKEVLIEPGSEDGIQLHEASLLAQPNVRFLAGRQAVSIDKQRQLVILENGELVPYAELVLATGSQPRILPAFPPGSPGVFYLRTLEDALALRAALEKTSSLIIIGGGVIGLEVAAAAAAKGICVSVIEAGDRIMARATSPELSRVLHEEHARRGVQIYCNAAVAGAELDGRMHVITLSDGRVLQAACVLVGIGVQPRTDLAEASGIACGPAGISVDGYGRTDQEHIYAAGEVVHCLYEETGQRMRHENWHHASAHGRHVGVSLVFPNQPYAEVTSYWTDQYDLNVNAFGMTTGEVNVVRGDLQSRCFTLFHLRDGVVAGVTSVNTPKDLRAGKKLVRAGARLQPQILSDSTVDLGTLANALPT